MDIDLERLTELMRLMTEHELTELEVESGDFKVRLKKRSGTGQPEVVAVHGLTPVAVPAAVPQAANQIANPRPPAPPTEVEDLIEITSPMVGTFYRAPAPEAEPYVRVGDLVHEETPVCIIEAMKVMNEIKAETEGTIVSIKVDNGEAVEFGQILFTVRPGR